MNLWVIKQFESTATEHKPSVIIGIFETQEQALAHISENLPNWAELWKTSEYGNSYTDGTHLIDRYVTEISTDNIFWKP